MSYHAAGPDEVGRVFEQVVLWRVHPGQGIRYIVAPHLAGWRFDITIMRWRSSACRARAGRPKRDMKWL